MDIQFYKRFPDPVRSSVLARASKCSNLNHWMLVHHSCYVLLFMSNPNPFITPSEPMYTIPCHAKEHPLNLIWYMQLEYTDKLCTWPEHPLPFVPYRLAQVSEEKCAKGVNWSCLPKKKYQKMNSGQSRIRTCNLLLPVLPLINLQNFLRTSRRRNQGHNLLTG